VADALGNCNFKAVFRHPEPADAKEWSLRLGDFDRTEYRRAVDPETGEPTGRATPRREAVPYATPRVLATLPDYHAFVARPGDTRPALVRLARAVPPEAREAAPRPVWDGAVVRWPEPAAEASPEDTTAVAPDARRGQNEAPGGDSGAASHPRLGAPSVRGRFLRR
jgi:hypothetical protein